MHIIRIDRPMVDVNGTWWIDTNDILADRYEVAPENIDTKPTN